MTVDLIDDEDQRFVLETTRDESFVIVWVLFENTIFSEVFDDIMLANVKKVVGLLSIGGEVVLTDHHNFWFGLAQVLVLNQRFFWIIDWNLDLDQSLCLAFDKKENGRGILLNVQQTSKEFRLVFHR